MTIDWREKMHKAEPAEDGLHCAICGQWVKHLPAGQGWVHSDSGAVLAPNPPKGV